MPRKPIELPPEVARRFVADMRAYFAEPNSIKRDGIAARQLHVVRQHYSDKLRLNRRDRDERSSMTEAHGPLRNVKPSQEFRARMPMEVVVHGTHRHLILN